MSNIAADSGKKLIAVIASMALLGTLYAVGPFLLLPSMLSNDFPSTSASTFNILYSRTLSALPQDNFYRRAFMNYSLRQCNLHPGKCKNLPAYSDGNDT